MTAHLDTEAAPASSGDAVEDFADFVDTHEEEKEETDDLPLEGEEALEADEPESDDTQDEGDEQDDPAIDPPISWGTDAKELFGQLPADLQKQVVEREAQREKFVQQKSAEAAQARQTASAEAAAQFADQQRQYASELEQYASYFAPQAPNPAMASTDPVAFIQLNAQYQAELAQQQQLQQRSYQARQEADYRSQQAEAAQFQADIAILEQAIPEWSDVAKRTEMLTDVTRIGAELGYTNEIMAQASAADVLALRKAAEWKAKASKYDALQKTRMETVRSAKTLPKVSRPGTAPTRGEVSNARAQQSWQNVKGAKSKDAQAAAFADYLENSGQF